MKKTKMLLSCVMMLMFSVAIFAGQCPKKNLDCTASMQAEQCCNGNEVCFMCDENMPMEKCPMLDCHVNCCEKMCKDLNITDKQKEDLKALKKSCLKKQQELMETIVKEKKTINKELLKGKYSQKVIKKSVKNIKTAFNKMIDNKIAKQQAFKKILTNEQYLKMFKPKTIIDILVEKLNLSGEQKEKVATIINNSDSKAKELMKRKFEKKNLLREELEKEICDKDTVSQLTKEVSDLSNELFQLKINTKMELKSVLFFEQYSKMEEMYHNCYNDCFHHHHHCY